MDTLMKADIFFFISSITSILMSLLVSIALFYLIKASRNLYLISKELQKHFKNSEEFILELKERLENNFIFKLFFPLDKSRKKQHNRKINK